ncbi:MAG: alpha-glucan family phosphorylase [Acidobacteria bacterium]|nr:MAG: alpha-glucan family phosphorylase [Acidobacteriota bacterium]REK03114.1 MAG: alpha-glucan family phosphorylase [Acidobacteriota bacterium]REK15462.1 MAG: alpha-glucan family phosphorylase [Acidobacteriota bacterium]REK45812.1 MAG: alpha-glucan family phosphorylase [Acidobacteriota bacterium]
MPPQLGFLEELSWNYFWSWCEGGEAVFRDLAPGLWEDCEQNPRQMLSRISEIALWQKAADRGYVARVADLEERFREYLSATPNTFGKVTPENPVAYFCAEYGVHNSLPIYSGGLGILAGDHLKSASDMNVPLVAVGLMYRYGYFRQKIAHDGWQEESYRNALEDFLALKPVNDENGERILVSITMRGRRVHAQAWLAQLGRIKLYLLDTNVAINDEVDRFVTGHLYGGDNETRIVQEKLLGIGGVNLLRKLGVEPSVYHLNEGHSAFLNVELAREFLEEDETLTFEDVVPRVRELCVFTTHTPVDAGNDSFPADLVGSCFDESYIESLRLEKEEFFALGRTDPEDENEWFGMTPLAIRLSRSSNGVSEKHGQVSRSLWKKMFTDIEEPTEVPITHITNGVHPATWISPAFKDLYRRHLGQDWYSLINSREIWRSAVNAIPDDAVWRAHQLLKNLLIAYVRDSTLRKDAGLKSTIHEREDTRKLFSDEILTVGFARRIAKYKRWDLILHDLDRLLKMVDDPKRPVQFVFAGKAHPQDNTAKAILQKLMSINHDSNWQNRAVFIEDYDQEVARYLVRGVDVWMNVPRRPLEASGTSGQKVAMNGGLNFSILDGWWIEGYNGENGFAIGDRHEADDENDSVNDINDADSLYSILEDQIIPEYYDRDEKGLPRKWIARMKSSLATLTPAFSSDRMLRDYIEQIYDAGETARTRSEQN